MSWLVAGKRGSIALMLMLAIAVLALSCASDPAPPQWTPTAEQSQADVYGRWIELEVSELRASPGDVREGRVRTEEAILWREPQLPSEKVGVLSLNSRVRLGERRGRFYGVEAGEGRGVWILVADVDVREGGQAVGGELIAIERDTVVVLAIGGIRKIYADEIRRARMFCYDSGWERLVPWTVIGGVLTASHGIWSVLSFPLCVGFGAATTVAASREARLDYPEDQLTRFREYARFPQGVPDGIDLGALELPSGRLRSPDRARE